MIYYGILNNNMVATNKKNKLRNSYQVNTALKDKGKGVKGLTFFTSSQRQENKKIDDGEFDSGSGS